MSNWDFQSDDVKVSGNYLEHVNTKKGRTMTNAEYYGVDPLTERTDLLCDNYNPDGTKDGTHRHFSVDAYGNIKNWGDHK